MSKEINKTALIGLLGGMGPEAAAYLFHEILRNTTTKKDQDHHRVLIYNNPKIPDRTEAILSGDHSLLIDLYESLALLEHNNVDFIIIPCVTSHYFYNELQSKTTIPILNIIECTLRAIDTKYKDVKKIGLLATTGTVRGNAFSNASIEYGLETLTPDEALQSKLMNAIYGEKGIKAGFLNSNLHRTVLMVAESLIERGAEVIVAGCTELPLLVSSDDFSVPYIDILKEYAITAVREAEKITEERNLSGHNRHQQS